MHRYPIKTAARLATASYDPQASSSVRPRLAASKNADDDVQAHLLDNGILLIPGSDGLRDYLRFNLRLFRIGGTRFRIDGTETERDGNTLWHQGFLAHAKAIQDWINARGGQKPIYIIGHSLGAASAQILSKLWSVPAIGFAAPRPCRTPAPLSQSRLCLCINRDDDLVTSLPGTFHHIGAVHTASARQSRLGLDHAMPHYKKVVAEQQNAQLLGKHWP